MDNGTSMSRSAMSIIGRPAASARSRATLPALSPWRTRYRREGQIASVTLTTYPFWVAICTPSVRIATQNDGLRSGGPVLGQLVERLVLLAGVDEVLELDHLHLGEPVAEPAVVGVEQAELLAVRDDLGEQQLLEQVVLRRHVDAHRLDGDLRVDAHPVPDLLLQEAVAHADGGLEGELLAVLHLRVGQAGVVLLQRQHTEGDVAGLVGHDVAKE